MTVCYWNKYSYDRIRYGGGGNRTGHASVESVSYRFGLRTERIERIQRMNVERVRNAASLKISDSPLGWHRCHWFVRETCEW
jgi:hypothetical protein